MKKLFLILFIAVIGLTANSYGQGGCETALIINPTDSVQRNVIPVNDSVYWVKFVATDTSIHIGMQTIYSDTNFVNQMTLYYAPNNCDAYTQLASINGIYLHYGNLIIGNTYLIKIHYNGSILKSSLAYYKGIDKALGKGLPDPNILPNLPNPICTGTYIPFTTDWNTTFYGIMMSVPLYYLWNNIPIGVYFYHPLPFAIYCIATNSQGTADITYQGYVTSNTQFAFSSTNCSTYNFTGSTCINPSLLNLCTFDYDYGDYTSHGTSLNSSHTYTNSGTYNVTLCITFNPVLNPFMYPQQTWTIPECISHQISTTTLPPVQFSSTSPQTIACGGNVTMQPSVPGVTIVSWQWTSNNTGNTVLATTQNFQVSPSVNTTYTVTATDTNGCATTGSFTVNMSPPTSLTITSDWGGKPCSEGVSFTFPLPATPGITYTWILPNNATIATTTATNNITVNWNNAGIATVIVEGRNANGCLVYQGSLLVNPNQTLCTATYAINNLNATQIKAMFGGVSTITTTQPILINGIITINENINFDACTDIKLGLNAKINVMPGCTLNILNATLNACDCPWDGIFVESYDARLYITNSYVSGAKNAVVSSYDGKINLYNSTFTDNQLGVWIRKYNPVPMQDHNGNIIPPAAHSAYIAKCLFSSNTKHYLKGIRIDTVYNVTIGDVSNITNRNEFYKLENAITSNFSDVTIYNNYFNNCERSTEPNPYYWNSEPTDAAIFIKRAYGQGMLPNSAIKNEVTIGGAATNQANTFYLQNVGIYAYLSSVYVRNNIFTDQRFSAIHLKELNKSEISFNTISMQNTTWATNNLYNSTILTENVMPLTYAAINVSSNTINNTRTGINVRNCNGDGSVYNYCNILTNNIFFSSTGADPSVAINASSSQYSLIDQNYIKNNMTTIPNYDRMLGIKLATVQNATVKRNQMIRLSSGIWGADNLLGTQFFCNDLDKNYYGFYFLPSYAVISNQGSASSASSNYWYDNVSYPTPEMRRMGGGIVLQGGNMVNWYHKGAFNSIPNIQSPYILQNNTHPLFNKIYPVANILFGNRCNIIAPLMNKSQERQEEMGAIVSDTTDFQVNPLENEYYAKDFSYRKLDDHPELLSMNAPDDSVYQNFYYTIKQQGIGKFAEVSKYINNQQYADAALLNEAIAPINTIESQKKTVNAIYLQCIVNNKPISTTDSLTLLNIAMQLPFMGGEAVYSARVILGLDPANLKLAYSKGPQKQPISSVESEMVLLYPNPASDIVNLIFNSETEGNTVFELYDISSRKLLMQNIPPKTIEYTISLINIKSGIYYCRISNNNNNVLLKSKLIITNK
ncbi:MAG: T9SS type A sorting domain-containing protein [Bacteroidetes bacterium]|nr:T9SS type A sorting domain-containing protein [Bacteroidota bacterium]